LRDQSGRKLSSSFLFVLALVPVLKTCGSKVEDDDENENENGKNKKAFIPAKQRMKAFSESPPHTRNGLASSFS